MTSYPLPTSYAQWKERAEILDNSRKMDKQLQRNVARLQQVLTFEEGSSTTTEQLRRRQGSRPIPGLIRTDKAGPSRPPSQTPRQQGSCFNCGSTQHLIQNCPFPRKARANQPNHHFNPRTGPPFKPRRFINQRRRGVNFRQIDTEEQEEGEYYEEEEAPQAASPSPQQLEDSIGTQSTTNWEDALEKMSGSEKTKLVESILNHYDQN